METRQHTPSHPPRPSRRLAERIVCALPVEVQGATGLTQNVSASGVYFETTLDQAPGSKVHFRVEVVVKGEILKMVCAGDVVRVDRKPGTVGIAVKLTSSFFTDTDHSEEPPEPLDD